MKLREGVLMAMVLETRRSVCLKFSLPEFWGTKSAPWSSRDVKGWLSLTYCSLDDPFLVKTDLS
jgi:hypothetical protein